MIKQDPYRVDLDALTLAYVIQRMLRGHNAQTGAQIVATSIRNETYRYLLLVVTHHHAVHNLVAGPIATTSHQHAVLVKV